jgi:Fe-S-cluster containining protein
MTADTSAMRCDGHRCAALAGKVGTSVACTIYTARPDVCRDCTPGDEACLIARAGFGMPGLADIAA